MAERPSTPQRPPQSPVIKREPPHTNAVDSPRITIPLRPKP
jgi:hypothetical protein